MDGYLIHLFSSKCIDKSKESIGLSDKSISRDVLLDNEDDKCVFELIRVTERKGGCFMRNQGYQNI